MSAQPFDQVITHPQGVGDGGEGWIHGADAGHEAGIHHIEVVELVGFAVQIQHGTGGIGTEAAGAGLVPHRRDRHGAFDVDLALHQMVLEI